MLIRRDAEGARSPLLGHDDGGDLDCGSAAEGEAPPSVVSLTSCHGAPASGVFCAVFGAACRGGQTSSCLAGGEGAEKKTIAPDTAG